MARKTIEIGEWMPDAYLSKEGIMTDVINLIPSTEGYSGVKSFKPSTNPLPDFDPDACYPTNAKSFIRANKEIVTVVGTDHNLYLRRGSSGWANVSKKEDSYTQSDSRWKFVLFGDLLIATNYADPVQCLDLSKPTAVFEDLAKNAPKARDLAIVNEFLVLVSTSDQYDGERPQRLWWSPIGDPRGDWTPNQTTMCDYQDIFTGSFITGVVGGEDALILLHDALVRMSFVGSPVVFQFQTVTDSFGNVGYCTYADTEGSVFFLSSAGFKQYMNGSVESIGLGKVDNFVISDTLGQVIKEAIACVDIRNNCVWWAYRDKTTAAPQDMRLTTRAVVYHYPSKRWGKLHDRIACFCSTDTKGYTLDELDEISTNVDLLPYSLDSEAWRGGVPVLTGFSSDGRFGYFLGPLYDAELTTGNFPLDEAHGRTFLRRVRPRVDGTATEMQVAVSGTQEELDPRAFTSYVNKTRVGDFPFRVTGRFHSIKLKLSGAFNKIVGFLLDYDSAGEY